MIRPRPVHGLVACLATAGCTPAASQGTAAPASEGAAVDAGPPSNRSPGETLTETVPLLTGDAVALESLRGKVVLLELSATWADHFADAHAVYRELLERHGESDLAVVAVGLDGDREALERYWERETSAFVLGWDPQGALAARLRAADLPTVFVLDRSGRIVHVQAGFAPADAERIGRHVAEAIGGATAAE